MSRISSLAVVFACLLTPVAAGEGYADREEVRGYLESLARSHGFDLAWLDAIVRDARRQESIIAAISRPAEKALAWHEYRKIFLTERRIAEGVDFWNANAAALDRAEAQFGVPPHVIVAIIGVETSYGGNTGSYRVIDALTTLGFDYPPRAEFFRGQLTEFLLLVREEGADAAALKGSYAGAMGLGQFIPSSYRSFAIDFDGDGKRDIWGNRTDAIGSVANYFARHKWRGDPIVAVEVTVDPESTVAADTGLKAERTAAQLRAQGVAVPAEVADSEPVALHRFEVEDGEQYWLGLHDFYVITRYNHSRMYALAVFQLAQAVRSRRLDGLAAGP